MLLNERLHGVVSRNKDKTSADCHKTFLSCNEPSLDDMGALTNVSNMSDRDAGDANGRYKAPLHSNCNTRVCIIVISVVLNLDRAVW